MKRTFKGLRTAWLASLIMCFMLCLTACGQQKSEPEDSPKIEGYAIQHEPEFGGVYIEIGIDDFNRLGFQYGDSVRIVFSNGYTLEDVPYYNGYYVDVGEALLIAYPGYDYIKAAINYGEDLWEAGSLYAAPDTADSARENGLFMQAKLDGHCTASVYLNERGKYADIQAARDIYYYDEREKYPSDEVFANFRNVTTGNLKESILYRAASPCDNQHNRASYVDALISKAQVRCILNLSDNDAKIEKYTAADDFDSPYFLSLYESGNVIPLAMNMNFTSDEFTEKLAAGFIAMSEKDGPYLIHCTEGKDRTGFVCMLIEALAGASYEEIVDDYMVTYDNYYKITKESDPSKYDVILDKNLIAMIRVVVGDDSVDITTADLSGYARDYLANAGMTDTQIDKLLACITE